jgi:hypothetical protein
MHYNEPVSKEISVRATADFPETGKENQIIQTTQKLGEMGRKRRKRRNIPSTSEQ